MITMLLIIINVSVYLIMSFANESKYHYFLKEYTINSSHTFMITGQDYYSLITSIFMHANITHIVMNMIALFQFGSLVEKNISAKFLLFLYFSAGITGSIFSMIYVNSFDQNTMVLGASGAIFGLIAFHGILNYGLFAVIGEFIVYHILIYVLRLPIAWYAHLGGALVGILFAYVFLSLLQKQKVVYHDINDI